MVKPERGYTLRPAPICSRKADFGGREYGIASDPDTHLTALPEPRPWRAHATSPQPPPRREDGAGSLRAAGRGKGRGLRGGGGGNTAGAGPTACNATSRTRTTWAPLSGGGGGARRSAHALCSTEACGPPLKARRLRRLWPTGRGGGGSRPLASGEGGMAAPWGSRWALHLGDGQGGSLRPVVAGGCACIRAGKRPWGGLEGPGLVYEGRRGWGWGGVWRIGARGAGSARYGGRWGLGDRVPDGEAAVGQAWERGGRIEASERPHVPHRA